MLATYTIQTLSLLCALVMAAPAPAAATAAGPTLSNVTASELGLAARDGDEDGAVSVAADLARIQYYTDNGCTKYNVGFTISTGRCWNYAYTGTHSANAVSSPGGPLDGFFCNYYTSKDCTGATHRVSKDGCVNDLIKYESVFCELWPAWE
ncbi:uncharacterized protein B0I36DRAFT_355801 [Microdochium trichocladiopsis]|uniref:Uncharacterized protein n=1 Tax=Microdochium trichocladiopsis TaxID=1682393 RepID=A0A9P9BIQ2_9PEZI|nr:uncharacterized protein B0I36DRAFT_355801 [Microdochium trichocladiopsis]KAH7014613.1 hypothetical protein B0I36DRAFT_355801 [Microdochium trichocladiopsis]